MFHERTTSMEFSCWCVPCLQLMSQTCSPLQELQKSHSNSSCSRTTHTLYKLIREDQRPRASQQLLVFLQWHFLLCPDEPPMSHNESPGSQSKRELFFYHSKSFVSHFFGIWGCSGNETMGTWEQHSPMSCCR